MKALTIHQPWAWAIVAGLKAVENRTWRTPYRGPLAIHAGISERSLEHGTRFCERHGIAVPADLVLGAVIGVVELVDVVPVADRPDDPWASGPWCWVLADPRPLETPVAARGMPGLFEVRLPQTESP